MITYLIRYNWAKLKGVIKPKEERKGAMLKDMVVIPFDEIEEQILTLCKAYNMDYRYLQEEVCYTDIGVLYAKYANEQAFKNYNDYLNLDDEQKQRHVYEWGEPLPFVYNFVSPEVYEEVAEKEQTELQKMYKNGGALSE